MKRFDSTLVEEKFFSPIHKRKKKEKRKFEYCIERNIHHIGHPYNLSQLEVNLWPQEALEIEIV